MLIVTMGLECSLSPVPAITVSKLIKTLEGEVHTMCVCYVVISLQSRCKKPRKTYHSTPKSFSSFNFYSGFI